AQGVLGGMRVRLDQNELARIHGCVGPLFFATAVALAVFTSRLWRDADDDVRVKPSPSGGFAQKVGQVHTNPKRKRGIIGKYACSCLAYASGYLFLCKAPSLTQ